MSDARETLAKALKDGYIDHPEAIREVLADLEDAQACIDSHGLLRTKVVEQSKEIVRLKADRDDARNYAAEIAHGVSHYPHTDLDPCVRCDRDRAEARIEAALDWLEPWTRIHEHLAKLAVDSAVKALRGEELGDK